MDVVDFALLPERPPMGAPAKGESVLVPYADWLMTRLLLAAPARLTAELVSGAASVSWQLHTSDPPADSTVDTLKSVLFRPVLARLAHSFMLGRAYGGFRRFHLRSGVLTHSVALYLGNDGLTGFWFRAHCGGSVAHDEPPAA